MGYGRPKGGTRRQRGEFDDVAGIHHQVESETVNIGAGRGTTQ